MPAGLTGFSQTAAHMFLQCVELNMHALRMSLGFLGWVKVHQCKEKAFADCAGFKQQGKTRAWF